MTTESKIEFTKNALLNADSLIRWAIVLNGAAAAGLLSFLGGAIDKQASFHSWSSFGTSLLLFGIGVSFALFASIGKLLAVNFTSQITDLAEKSTEEEIKIYLVVGDRAVIFAVVASIALVISLGIFATGIYVGKVAIFG